MTMVVSDGKGDIVLNVVMTMVVSDGNGDIVLNVVMTMVVSDGKGYCVECDYDNGSQ